MKNQQKTRRNIPNVIKAMNATYDLNRITEYENQIACMFASPIMFVGTFVNFAVGYLILHTDLYNTLISSAIFLCLGILFELFLRVRIKSEYINYFVTLLYTVWFLFSLIRLYYILGPAVWMISCIHIVFAMSRIKHNMAYALGIVTLLSIAYCILHAKYFQFTMSYTFIISQLVLMILLVVMLLIIQNINTGRYNQLLNNYEIVWEQKNDINALYEEVSASEEELLHQNERLSNLMSEIKTGEDLLYDLAYKDVLTRLPNRITFMEKLDNLIIDTKNSPLIFYVIFIDIDSFKKINDTLGHNIGDNFLVFAAEKLISSFQKEDFIGRIGGDEFAIIIHRNIRKEELIKELEDFRTDFCKPYCINNLELRLSASFGIAIYPDDGDNSSALLQCADMSLYKAKELGKNNIQFFNKNMLDRMLFKTKVENLLLHALNNNEFYLEFQPQFCVTSNRIRGIEALTRWKSPELGAINPIQFIPIAEETGLINLLGEWILRTACHKLKTLQEKYNFDAILCVNISTIQIVNDKFIDIVKDILNETNMDPKYIELEITESVVIESFHQSIRILNELKELGLRIALDDFGMGYSSLNYLKSLPIDTLKVDKSFVDNLSMADVKRQIIGDIIHLGHTLGLTIIAEGVENENQLKYLKKHSCDYIQGFLYSRPLEEDALIQLLNERK